MKHKPQNWRKVDPDLFKKFKVRAIELGMKVYDAQTIAINLFLQKHLIKEK